MDLKEVKKRIKQSDFFDLTPVRVHEHYEGDDGVLTIVIPKFRKKFMRKYVAPRMKHPNYKLDLDDVGKTAYKNIDGERKVSDIAEIMKEEFGEKIEPMEERLNEFFRRLYTGSLITFNELKK